MVVQINSPMIEHYLDYVTVMWFNDEDMPPEHVEDYLKYVQYMREEAIENKDLDLLKIAFEYLLTHPEIDCEEYAGGRFPYDDNEIREIIQFAYKTIWPDAGPIDPSKVPEIEFINIPMYDWWELRRSEK